MIINGNTLLLAAPILNMEKTKLNEFGVSYGLGEAGYDIRIKQEIRFKPYEQSSASRQYQSGVYEYDSSGCCVRSSLGRFTLASSIEEFDMPNDLTGIVHDKSTWARRGLSVFNTIIESGWKGFLTLELVYHGNKDLVIPAGAGIAQVIFHKNVENVSYSGKYQNQEDMPVQARIS